MSANNNMESENVEDVSEFYKSRLDNAYFSCFVDDKSETNGSIKYF